MAHEFPNAVEILKAELSARKAEINSAWAQILPNVKAELAGFALVAGYDESGFWKEKFEEYFPDYLPNFLTGSGSNIENYARYRAKILDEATQVNELPNYEIAFNNFYLYSLSCHNYLLRSMHYSSYKFTKMEDDAVFSLTNCPIYGVDDYLSRFVSLRLKDNAEFMLAILPKQMIWISGFRNVLAHASTRLKEDESFIRQYFKKFFDNELSSVGLPSVFSYLSPRLRSDSKFMLDVLKTTINQDTVSTFQDTTLSEFIETNLYDDKEFMLAAVRINRGFFKHASPRLRADLGLKFAAYFPHLDWYLQHPLYLARNAALIFAFVFLVSSIILICAAEVALTASVILSCAFTMAALVTPLWFAMTGVGILIGEAIKSYIDKDKFAPVESAPPLEEIAVTTPTMS